MAVVALPSFPAGPIFGIPDAILRGASFTLPEKPYAFNASQPCMNIQTMKIHHGKHHAAFVINLNKAAESLADLPENPKTVLADMKKYSAAARNDGCGHWNHTFFLKYIHAHKENNLSQAKIAEAVYHDFGSFEELKKKFKETPSGQFGSGRTWLIKEPGGKLIISGEPGQGNLIKSLSAKKGIPYRDLMYGNIHSA